MNRIDLSNWREYNNAIILLLQELSDGTPLDIELRNTKSLLEDYSCPIDDELQNIIDSYGLMRDFMLQGYRDETRAVLYQQLCQRLYRKLSDLSLQVRAQFDSSLKSVIPYQDLSRLDVDGLRSSLESFVSEMAMLTLEPELSVAEKRATLYERRQANVSKAFVQIMVSGQWSNEQAGEIAKLLLSPVIEKSDILTLCAAVMMGSLLSPDPAKVLVLMKIYRESTDEKLRQRALIGWVFALNNGDFQLFPNICDEVESMMKNSALHDDLVELQMQVIFCMSAEQDTQTIEREVMPHIMKNQNLEITRFGIREKEDNNMDDILNGDTSDKKIEEIEHSIRKMADMQKRGADIYFGGFSKMKRFGFFFTLSNWFTPFFLDHPGLTHINPDVKKAKFMSSLLSKMPFCDSDKYSFALAISSVFSQLPDNIKEMMGNYDNFSVSGMEGMMDTPAFYRRQYLQDLYRFFRINDSRKVFRNPFSSDNGELFLGNKMFGLAMHDGAISTVGFLIKREMYFQAKKLLDNYFDENKLNDLLLAARLGAKEKDFAKAESFFAKAYSIAKDDERAIRGYAISSFHCAHYAQATRLYHKLVSMFPDKTQYQMDEAVSLINEGRNEEAVRILFELYYNNQNNIEIRRVLAWGLLETKKPDKAKKLYDGILEFVNNVDNSDFLNMGYCAWFLGNCDEAAKYFAKFVKLSLGSAYKKQRRLPKNILLDKFKEDAKLLDGYDIPAVDRLVMAGVG